MNTISDSENLTYENDRHEEDIDFDEDEEYEEDNEDDEYEEEVCVKDIGNEEDMIIQDMADFLKIFGEYSRIKILESIMDIKYTVSDISCFTGLTESAVCYHLKVLKQAKIVVSKRSGKYVYYVVCDKHVKEIYNKTRAHIEEFKKTISLREEYDEMTKIFDDELL